MMPCTRCGQLKRMTELQFVPAGMVPGLSIKANDAVCSACMRKVPIDDTSWDGEREPGCDDDLGEEAHEYEY